MADRLLHMVADKVASMVADMAADKKNFLAEMLLHMMANKVAGNFHVAPGKAFQSAQGQLVHEFKPFDTHTYNVSHIIHSLSFGLHYPNRVNPLDESRAILKDGSGGSPELATPCSCARGVLVLPTCECPQTPSPRPDARRHRRDPPLAQVPL